MNNQKFNNFLKDPQTNWKYILLVTILAFIVGGGILGYQYWWLPKQEIPIVPLMIERPEKVKIESNDWKSYATELNYFKDKNITALAIGDNNLYVALYEGKQQTYFVKLYILNLVNNSLTDVSDKLVTTDKDTITQIRVDRIKKELWIETNGNGFLSDSYDYSLNIKKRYSDANSTSKYDPQREFIESYFSVYEELSKEGSIIALAFDDLQAVIGFYKGDVYLYSFKNKNYEMIYKPTSIYYWPISSALLKDLAFVGTRGDGLVVIDRTTGKWKRYFHENYDVIQSLTSNDKYIYIGGRGLFVGEIKNFQF